MHKVADFILWKSEGKEIRAEVENKYTWKEKKSLSYTCHLPIRSLSKIGAEFSVKDPQFIALIAFIDLLQDAKCLIDDQGNAGEMQLEALTIFTNWVTSKGGTESWVPFRVVEKTQTLDIILFLLFNFSLTFQTYTIYTNHIIPLPHLSVHSRPYPNHISLLTSSLCC